MLVPCRCFCSSFLHLISRQTQTAFSWQAVINYDPNFEKMAAMKQRIDELERQLAMSSSCDFSSPSTEQSILIAQQIAEIASYKKVVKRLRKALADAKAGATPGESVGQTVKVV